METIVEALGPWIACKQSLSHSLNIHRCHRKTQSASVAASIPFLVRGHIFLLDPLFHALNNVKFHLSMAEIYHSPWLSSSFCFFLWSAGALGDPAQLSGDLSDELNAVAEQLWKDELAKGIKPKASAVGDKGGDVVTIVTGRVIDDFWNLEESKPQDPQFTWWLDDLPNEFWHR